MGGPQINGDKGVLEYLFLIQMHLFLLKKRRFIISLTDICMKVPFVTDDILMKGWFLEDPESSIHRNETCTPHRKYPYLTSQHYAIY